MLKLMLAAAALAAAVPTAALAAGRVYFEGKGSYEQLSKGTYTWRVSRVGVSKMPAHVELTVRW